MGSRCGDDDERRRAGPKCTRAAARVLCCAWPAGHGEINNRRDRLTWSIADRVGWAGGKRVTRRRVRCRRCQHRQQHVDKRTTREGRCPGREEPVENDSVGDEGALRDAQRAPWQNRAWLLRGARGTRVHGCTGDGTPMFTAGILARLALHGPPLLGDRPAHRPETLYIPDHRVSRVESASTPTRADGHAELAPCCKAHAPMAYDLLSAKLSLPSIREHARLIYTGEDGLARRARTPSAISRHASALSRERPASTWRRGPLSRRMPAKSVTNSSHASQTVFYTCRCHFCNQAAPLRRCATAHRAGRCQTQTPGRRLWTKCARPPSVGPGPDPVAIQTAVALYAEALCCAFFFLFKVQVCV